MTVSADQISVPVLRCPSCRRPLSPGWDRDERCESCGIELPIVDDVPVLVHDRERLAEILGGARSSERRQWYEEPHASSWTGPYRHHVRKRQAYLNEVLARFAREHAAEPTVGLDLGCGDGQFLDWLSGYVSVLYGSDYNMLRLQRAARQGHAASVLLAEVLDFPALDDAFDLIVFNHVIEHIPDDSAALNEIRRLLKPGGLCILGTPNEGAAWWQLAYRLQPAARASTDHVHFYTAEVLAERCRSAGLRVLHVERLGWGLPHWRLDAMVRGHKVVDDVFTAVGRRLVPSQASSLYLLLEPESE
jgi:2-polyprenyl-3-methyl-5-hydroxy-6-metoxy-1,4-benzoquinol methylase